MDKFLAQFSKTTIATVTIVGGILFMVLIYDPPRSVCDTQMEKVREMQKLFLFKEASKKGLKVKYICYRKADPLLPINIKSPKEEEEYACSKYQSLRDRCKRTNEPGGCYELFQGIKILLSDLDSLSRECASAAGNISEVKAAIRETLELLVRLAWGDKPPNSYTAKLGWLDSADVSLYCKLRNRYQSMNGEPAWSSFRQNMLLELPGAKELARNEVWDLSIFSENCARYP